jgi:ABC-2 type transport system permease protein
MSRKIKYEGVYEVNTRLDALKFVISTTVSSEIRRFSSILQVFLLVLIGFYAGSKGEKIYPDFDSLWKILSSVMALYLATLFWEGATIRERQSGWIRLMLSFGISPHELWIGKSIGSLILGSLSYIAILVSFLIGYKVNPTWGLVPLSWTPLFLGFIIIISLTFFLCAVGLSVAGTSMALTIGYTLFFGLLFGLYVSLKGSESILVISFLFLLLFLFSFLVAKRFEKEKMSFIY